MSEGAAQIDSKGRLTIPRGVRQELGLEPGTVVYVRSVGGFGRFGKATSPFEELAAAAVAEYRQGLTRSLRDIIAEEEAAG